MSESLSGNAVEVALDAFVRRYQREFPEIREPFDPEWRSPCEVGSPGLDDSGTMQIRWQPTRRSVENEEVPSNDFDALERALELTIHPDIKRYYGRYWSGGLEAEAADGHVSLLFIWNAEDIGRLTENLIGHALAKRQSRTGFSVFFACTELDSELFLTVDNDSGAVLLEKPGRKPVRTVASSLAEFLATLSPAPPTLHPERVGRVEF